MHPTQVDASFTHSLLATFVHDLTGPQHLGPWIAARAGSGGLVAARNEVAAAFLATDAAWLWWIDTDMGFTPDSLDRLLEVADPESRPVVAGLCFAQMEREPDGMGGFRVEVVPALYRWHEGSDGRAGFVPWLNYPQDAVAEVAGVGSAFTLIHRSVFERVAEHHGPRWYDRMTNPTTGQLVGEDLAFCARARGLGIPIHVHTGVATTHRKPRWVGPDDYDHPGG